MNIVYNTKPWWYYLRKQPLFQQQKLCQHKLMQIEFNLFYKFYPVYFTVVSLASLLTTCGGEGACTQRAFP